MSVQPQQTKYLPQPEQPMQMQQPIHMQQPQHPMHVQQPQQPMHVQQPQQPMHVQQPQQPSLVQQQQQNTVIIQQQPQSIMEKPPPRDWNESLCGCFSDCSVCMFAWCCPTCFDCHLAMQAGESCCLPCCFPFGWLVALRAKHRASHNIQGSVLQDCWTVTCCGTCAGCQLAREIAKYGN